MNIISIFATDMNSGIGYQNSLPWPFNRKDMQNFLSLTVDKIVVMGSSTWYSLPNKLTNRVNVVVSNKSKEELRYKDKFPDYVIAFQTLDEFQKHVTMISDRYAIPDVCIIGGKTLYEQLNPIVDVIIHTQIKGNYLCDTYLSLPELFQDFTQTHLTEDDSNNFTVNIYQRKSK